MSKYWINLSKDSFVGHGLVEVNTVINNKYMVCCADVVACNKMECDHCILDFDLPYMNKYAYVKNRIEEEI